MPVADPIVWFVLRFIGPNSVADPATAEEQMLTSL